MEAGRRAEQLEMAAKMKAKGIPLADIGEITGLWVEKSMSCANEQFKT
ncbi:MAG: hypothetical protein GX663_00665 [Clostridiales bacterium]|nr:hypothetical protein [Clostridiales bacterium]